MRCYICDRVVDEPKFNADHEDFDPCDPCKAVIQDTLDGFKDNPHTDEVASPDPTYEGLYPTAYSPFDPE